MAILKTVLSLTVLLVIGNILGTEGFLDIPDNLFQVTHTNVSVPLDHLREKRDAQLPSEYIIEIEVNVPDLAVLNEVQCLFQNVSFPLQVDTRINITHVNLTTVCNISECTIPSNGPFCPASTTPTIPPTTTLDSTLSSSVSTSTIPTKPPTKTSGTTPIIPLTTTRLCEACLLPEIEKLLSESKVLDKKGIPEFVKHLYDVNKESMAHVVISTANILTDVDILQYIVVAINGTRFNDSVIQNFLNTVDILVSEETTLTWSILNNNTTTKDTGSKLLKSVEEIVKVINETSTNISTPTMQLNKTIYSKAYNIPYFNSTDEVMVLQSMPSSLSEITTVRFLTLDIVLPPRNLTSSNNTINGAVLLAYTNSTITNITLTFQIKNTTLDNPQCVFWNFTEKAWDSSGCVKNVGKKSITCVCNHLTSFSMLMSPSIPKEFIRPLDFITYIGVGISMGSLVLCLIIEAIVWTAVTRNNISYMRHVTIVNIAVSLLIANIWFIIGAFISKSGETPVGPCSAATFFIHFFYLALFFWMLISGVLLFYHMVMVFSHMSKRVMMAISFTVGYGAPLIIAVVTVAVTAPRNEYFQQNGTCWLNWTPTKALLAFVIPALAIVAINFIILIVVLYKLIRRGTGENQTDERNAVVVIARCIAVLTPFFGLTWAFGIGIMIRPDISGLHIVFAVLNSLQGFFVLVFGILLDSRIRAALAGRFSFIHTSSNRTRSTSGGPSSSSGLGLFRRRHRRDTYHVSEVASSSQSTAASESFLNT